MICFENIYLNIDYGCFYLSQLPCSTTREKNSSKFIIDRIKKNVKLSLRFDYDWIIGWSISAFDWWIDSIAPSTFIFC